MRSKATFLTGFAAGYVLGSRAGRQRYEQIKRAAQSFAASPTVQSATGQVQQQAGAVLTTAKDRATGAIGEKLQDRRPAWMSRHDEPAHAHDAGSAGWAAGSNGHVGA